MKVHRKRCRIRMIEQKEDEMNKMYIENIKSQRIILNRYSLLIIYKLFLEII